MKNWVASMEGTARDDGTRGLATYLSKDVPQETIHAFATARISHEDLQQIVQAAVKEFYADRVPYTALSRQFPEQFPPVHKKPPADYIVAMLATTVMDRLYEQLGVDAKSMRPNGDKHQLHLLSLTWGELYAQSDRLMPMPGLGAKMRHTIGTLTFTGAGDSVNETQNLKECLAYQGFRLRGNLQSKMPHYLAAPGNAARMETDRARDIRGEARSLDGQLKEATGKKDTKKTLKKIQRLVQSSQDRGSTPTAKYGMGWDHSEETIRAVESQPSPITRDQVLKGALDLANEIAFFADIRRSDPYEQAYKRNPGRAGNFSFASRAFLASRIIAGHELTGLMNGAAMESLGNRSPGEKELIEGIYYLAVGLQPLFALKPHITHDLVTHDLKHPAPPLKESKRFGDKRLVAYDPKYITRHKKLAEEVAKAAQERLGNMPTSGVER